MILRAACVAFLAASTAFGQFRYEREIAPGAAGPNRLDLDAGVVAGGAPDLRDFRIVDAAGREIPYLIVEPSTTAPEWRDASTIPVQTTKTTSGFEVDLRSAREIDRFRVHGLDAPFMKHVRLEGSGDRTRWNLLADATLFDLPDQKLRQHEIGFEAGSYRYLRVTWDDRSSARVRGTAVAAARIHKIDSPSEPLRSELNYLVSSDSKATRYRIQLPAANLPTTAIDVQVAAPGDVFRNAVVSEPSLVNGEIVQVDIGSSTLRRAIRDGALAADLSIPIRRPSGRELLLTIDSTGKRPLAVTALFAVYAPQPWIYFEVPNTHVVNARYGDLSAKAAQYDLEAARRFIDRSRPAKAKWLTPPAGALTAPPPLSLPMPERGATIAANDYRFSRSVPAAKGLVVLQLDAHVLAHTHSAAADVRVVDAQSRQIPYVVERRPEPMIAELKIPPSRQEKARSIYRLAMPYDTLPGDVMLVLATHAGVFERHVSLVAGSDDRRAREPFETASAAWRNSDADIPAPSLTLGPIPQGTKVLDVIVDEGDNAPLPLTSARLLLPNYALRFRGPGEPLSLVYGNRNAQAPLYDLAILAPQLFTLPARELQAGPVRGKVDRSGNVQRRYFWIVIGAAVIVLGGLLARLLTGLRSEESRPLGGAPGGGDPSR